MPRHTLKYAAALQAARDLRKTGAEIKAGATAEVLYKQLKALNFDWDSRQQMWLSVPPAQPASDVLRVRVWTRGDVVNSVADTLVELIEGCDMNLLERSEAYPCRAPKQNESRVYLTFTPKVN